MTDREESPSARARPLLYCIVPRDLAAKLHDLLRRHFRDDPGVEVIVERRAEQRRATAERRGASEAEPPQGERRRTRDLGGRRVGERRAALVAVAAPPPPLPRKARAHAERLVFVERLEPSDEQLEDLDTARLVARIQGGERDAYAQLYLRYFDRVYAYLRLLLKDVHEAEDVTQQVFVKVLEVLPRYERRSVPFRAWLFTIVRNHALKTLARRQRVDLADPADLAARPEPDGPAQSPANLGALGWISDPDVLTLIERLPAQQRQVLAMRYMLDLPVNEIARVLDTTPNHISVLHYRAIGFLRDRLAALGREPSDIACERMRRRPKQARVLRRRRFALSP